MEEKKRTQWGSKQGFILAAVGSAIGLGNIWRFPYTVYDNGGGAFMIPYLIALLTTGISVVALEFVLGQRYRGSAPLTWQRIHKKFEFLGWWQVLVPFVIATYYSVIVAWALSYTFFSLKLSWGSDTNSFFFSDYLNVQDGNPFNLGEFEFSVLIPLLLIWGVILAILFKGVKEGIERVNKIAIPVLVVIFLIIVLRSVTLPGATQGLDALFKPDWSGLTDPRVWAAAYGQIFYSLSIGFGIMITYSSYLPKKTDTTNSAFITAFSNSSFELLAGIGVFAALGFMAQNAGVDVKEVATGGIGLAFVVFPEIINQLPMSQLFGFLFFISLVIAGITSMISLMEVVLSAFIDKFSFARNKAVAVIGGIMFAASLLYATRSGVMILDVVDNFINQFGILFAGLVEVVVLALVLRKLDLLKNHANSESLLKLGGSWKISLTVITPIMLGYMLVDAFINAVKTPYGGYPLDFLAVFGWGIVGLIIVISFLIPLKKFKTEDILAGEALRKEWEEVQS